MPSHSCFKAFWTLILINLLCRADLWEWLFGGLHVRSLSVLPSPHRPSCFLTLAPDMWLGIGLRLRGSGTCQRPTRLRLPHFLRTFSGGSIRILYWSPSPSPMGSVI